MKNKIFIFSLLFLFTLSCSSGSKRSDSADEFLIEKKNPLVMPPDIEDLPTPKEKKTNQIEESDFKESLKQDNDVLKNSDFKTSKTLEESLIKKIGE